MRRITLIFTTLLLGAGGLAAVAVGEDTRKYKIEFDNAFGLVEGSEVKVAGVVAGTVKELDINSDKRALLDVELSGDLSQLGVDTICESKPQSLIAEYAIDCTPKGPPLEEGATIPVAQTRQTVQNDLVQSGLREPFKRRFQLILNEFGTGVAGNSESLNQAIRRGAPALRETRKVLAVLGDQNELIRDLNVNSDTIFVRLAEQRSELRRFLTETADISQATAERKEDLSTDFQLLDDFLAELDPTLVELGNVTREQTPLLRDLRTSASGLNELARRIPAFSQATARSLVALGDASEPGERALTKGADEIAELKRSTRNAFPAAESFADFFEDLDDPNRAVEVDSRAARDSGRAEPTGYTGLEGLLNYVYYQPGAVNQFTQIGHALHISIFELETYPCGGYNGGGEPGTPEFGVPAADGGTTTDFLEAHRCVSWLGPTQPGINAGPELPPYDPSVCPEGSAAPELCEPAGSAQATSTKKTSSNDDPEAPAPAVPEPELRPPADGGEDESESDRKPPTLNETLEDLLDLPKGLGDALGGGGGNRGGGGALGNLGSLLGGGKQGAGSRRLLDFLFGN